ncbi:MAG: creatininase family protein [Gemmatimonadales bacterium]
MPQNILLEHMTSPEVRRAIDSGYTTAVVACGAVEQHGPHLPLCMDAEHGTRLAEEVARRLGDALVAPTIRVGCSEHHMKFAGTFTLRRETFEALCQDYCTSLSRHGFRVIYFVPSHGGNFEPLAEMQPRLQEAVGPAVQVVVYSDLVEVIELWRRVVEEEAGLGGRVGGHADIAESSIMLALHPELVRMSEAAEGYVGPITPELMSTVFRDGIGAIAPNGIIGDARGMQKAIGERCIAEMATVLVRHFRTAEGP